jgi:hypothetical protein
MKALIDVLAITSFVISFIPTCINILVLIFWMIVPKTQIVLKWYFYLFLAMSVWPIAYWIQ